MCLYNGVPPYEDFIVKTPSLFQDEGSQGSSAAWVGKSRGTPLFRNQPDMLEHKRPVCVLLAHFLPSSLQSRTTFCISPRLQNFSKLVPSSYSPEFCHVASPWGPNLSLPESFFLTYFVQGSLFSLPSPQLLTLVHAFFFSSD